MAPYASFLIWDLFGRCYSHSPTTIHDRGSHEGHDSWTRSDRQDMIRDHDLHEVCSHARWARPNGWSMNTTMNRVMTMIALTTDLYHDARRPVCLKVVLDPVAAMRHDHEHDLSPWWRMTWHAAKWRVLSTVNDGHNAIRLEKNKKVTAVSWFSPSTGYLFWVWSWWTFVWEVVSNYLTTEHSNNSCKHIIHIVTL